MSFADIKGQDNALLPLKNSIIKGHIFSSYLFVGPEGIGKFMVAKNFAKAINCLKRNTKTSEPCESCSSCRKINSGIHPDVYCAEPKGLSASIGIGEIRFIIAGANLKPYEARKKVFIINNAHSMKNIAANAFLKALEEPSEDTVFILISRSRASLLPTVVSRCHVIRFSSAPVEFVSGILKEKLALGEDEAVFLGNFSAGCIGKAISMYSQGPEKESMMEKKNRIIDGLLGIEKDFTEEISSYSGREELKDNIEIVISYLRDVLLYKTMKDETMIFNRDRLPDIKKREKIFNREKLEELIKNTIRIRSYIDYNVNPKIAIDVLSNGVKNVLSGVGTSKPEKA